ETLEGCAGAGAWTGALFPSVARNHESAVLWIGCGRGPVAARCCGGLRTVAIYEPSSATMRLSAAVNPDRESENTTACSVSAVTTSTSRTLPARMADTAPAGRVTGAMQPAGRQVAMDR